MLKQFTRLKFEEKTDDNGGAGGTGYEQDTPPADEPAKTEGTKKEGSPTDFYDSQDDDEKQEESKADDKKKEEEPAKQAENDKKVEDPATGYGDDDSSDDDKKEEDPKETPDDDDKDKGGKLNTEGLSQKEVENIQSLAKKMDLTDKQAQALVDERREYNKQIDDALKADEKARETAKKERRANWQKELKEDPDFGGAEFTRNLQTTERVLHDFFPNLKKQLTDSKGMLPPYVMRDLKKLGDHLYKGDSVVDGDPPAPPKEEKEDNDPLSFYS